MKRNSKIVWLLIVLSVLVLAFASCKKPDDPGNGNTPGVVDDDVIYSPQVNTTLVLGVGIKESDVNAIKTAYYRLTDKDIPMVPAADAQTAHEIIVGMTDRELSKKAYRTLELLPKEEDDVGYVIYSDGKSVAIAFNTDSYGVDVAFLEAIENFVENYVKDESLKLEEGPVFYETFDPIEKQNKRDKEAEEKLWEFTQTQISSMLGGDQTSVSDIIDNLISIFKSINIACVPMFNTSDVMTFTKTFYNLGEIIKVEAPDNFKIEDWEGFNTGLIYDLYLEKILGSVDTNFEIKEDVVKDAPSQVLKWNAASGSISNFLMFKKGTNKKIGTNGTFFETDLKLEAVNNDTVGVRFDFRSSPDGNLTIYTFMLLVDGPGSSLRIGNELVDGIGNDFSKTLDVKEGEWFKLRLECTDADYDYDYDGKNDVVYRVYINGTLVDFRDVSADCMSILKGDAPSLVTKHSENDYLSSIEKISEAINDIPDYSLGLRGSALLHKVAMCFSMKKSIVGLTTEIEDYIDEYSAIWLKDYKPSELNKIVNMFYNYIHIINSYKV